MPSDIQFNANDNTFDINSLKQFAQEHNNSKILLHSDGDVSIKGVITSRLPGTGGARLNAAHAFLNTLKKEYGEEIASKLAKDAQFQNLFTGKPLSSRRIRLVIEQAENTLASLNGIRQAISQLSESPDQTQLASLKKMASDIEHILDKRAGIELDTQSYSQIIRERSLLKSRLYNEFEAFAGKFGITIPENEKTSFSERFLSRFLATVEKNGVQYLTPNSVHDLIEAYCTDSLKNLLFENSLCLKMHGTFDSSHCRVGNKNFNINLASELRHHPEIAQKLKQCSSAAEFKNLLTQCQELLTKRETVLTQIGSAMENWYQTFAQKVADKMGFEYDTVLQALKANSSISTTALSQASLELEKLVLEKHEEIDDMNAEFKSRMQTREKQLLEGLEFAKTIDIPQSEQKQFILDNGIRSFCFRDEYGKGYHNVSHHPLLQKPNDGSRTPLLTDLLNLSRPQSLQAFIEGMTQLGNKLDALVKAMFDPFDENHVEHSADEDFNFYNLCIIKLNDQITNADRLSEEKVTELTKLIQENANNIPEHAMGLMLAFLQQISLG